jgi:hypothetical protein
MRTPVAGAVLVVVLATGGCRDPYANAPAAPSATAAASPAPRPAPDVGDTGPGPAARRPAAVRVEARASRSPAAVARAYSQLTTNWDGNTLVRQLSRAARLSTGALRAQTERAAEDARHDASLPRERQGSRGRVLAVVVRGHGPTRQLVVVSSEQQLQAGRPALEGARARVYAAAARRTSAGWRLTAWELRP